MNKRRFFFAVEGYVEPLKGHLSSPDISGILAFCLPYKREGQRLRLRVLEGSFGPKGEYEAVLMFGTLEFKKVLGPYKNLDWFALVGFEPSPEPYPVEQKNAGEDWW